MLNFNFFSEIFLSGDNNTYLWTSLLFLFFILSQDLRFYKRVTLDFNDQLDDVHARIAERYDLDSDKNGE